MKKIIKEFNYTFMCGKTETKYNFKAIIKSSYFPRYRVKATATRFENGKIKGRTKSELYFENKNDMINEIMFQYELCKKSSFTKSLEIIK